MLDAYSRRHEGQKIYLRQAAAQRWIGWREQVLQGQRPQTGHTQQLAACDSQLRAVCTSHSTKRRNPASAEIAGDSRLEGRKFPYLADTTQQELAAITDDSIYSDMRSSDYQMGRWTLEDPSLRNIQRWVRARR